MLCQIFWERMEGLQAVSQPESSIFATLRSDARIWAIGSIHGEAEKLGVLHQKIANLQMPGDQLVYLGNYCGYGAASRETIEQMLIFRRWMLARPGSDIDDIVFLRGAQEEMWQKLLQLQFAPNPVQVLQWMVDQGSGPTIEAYGESVEDAMLAGRDGILALTKWTSRLRQSMRNHDGHTALMNALKHAAFTENNNLLFVHAGIDPARPLSAQSDSFWWGGAGFSAMGEPYEGYRRVIRGYDRRHGGVAENAHTVTLDGGAGFGGEIACACFAPSGALLHLLSSGDDEAA